jgi:hypothetical protein
MEHLRWTGWKSHLLHSERRLVQVVFKESSFALDRAREEALEDLIRGETYKGDVAPFFVSRLRSRMGVGLLHVTSPGQFAGRNLAWSNSQIYPRTGWSLQLGGRTVQPDPSRPTRVFYRGSLCPLSLGVVGYVSDSEPGMAKSFGTALESFLFPRASGTP